MLESLAWKPLPDAKARELLAKTLEIEDQQLLEHQRVHGSIAPLPPYRLFQLVRLTAAGLGNKAESQETLYALVADIGQVLPLDGSSNPVHDANLRESLELTEATVPDYIRFFCFAVRSSEGAFVLLEPARIEGQPPRGAAAAHAKTIVVKGRDDKGRFLSDVAISYNGSIFASTMAVAADGNIEMTDDELQTTDVGEDDVPVLPPLGPAAAPTLRNHLAAKRSGAAPRPVAAPSPLPPLQVLVELLLERALQKQASHRLIESFRASSKAVPPLDEFAALVVQASPVVIIESSLPFVEETIGRIVLARNEPRGAYELVGGEVSVNDDTEVTFRIQGNGPGLVLVPLQVYRRVTNVDRLAFNLASKDLSAIIACEQMAQLPESLRRLVDIVLRLPGIDGQIFETMFERVMGEPLPGGWAADGAAWVKHVQYTDFEHPRRMKLSAADAFEYLRQQVAERLGAVNASDELSLKQLHGLGEARQFADDLIADIHAAIQGRIEWAQVDRGALLVGPPGTGKTTLAKAIAKDCGVRFIAASATGWQATGQHLGHHIAAIRKTFSEARQYAPTILFIDEIDSIGNRETFSGQGAQYAVEVVNALLEQLQGIDPAAPVFVIAATNHEDRVDPALRRSGRLDRVIRIPRPNTESLGLIYTHYLGRLSRSQVLDPGIDTAALGKLSLGLTGADVERIVRGAARRARKESRALTQIDLLGEITNKPRNQDGVLRMTPFEIERTAVHEAGHALAMFLSSSKGADIGFMSVIPREDGTLGFVAPSASDQVSYTRRDYLERIEVNLGGRAAEELRYGGDQVTDGASSDLQSATRLAIAMVTRLGLGRQRKLLWSQEATGEDFTAANDILVEAYDRILERLRGQSARLDKLAKALAASQELSGDQVRGILELGAA